MVKTVKNRRAEAGNKGEGVRSDCHVTLELNDHDGIDILLRSKVQTLYGNHIRDLVTKQIQSYGLSNINIEIIDSGALDFVILARVEAAVSKIIDIPAPFLPAAASDKDINLEKNRLRLSRLYLPGNTPSLMINAGIHKPYGVILDLEDSVAPEKKDEARLLVRNALCTLDFYGAERMVRINPFPVGEEDLKAILKHHVEMILIPKVENPGQIHEIEQQIEKHLDASKQRSPFLMPILETAMGIENAYTIATTSPRIAAMAIGLEDLTADMGITRTKGGEETRWARSRMINACKAAGIQPIDSVFSDVSDSEGLLNTARRSKAMGFEGMGCIHPRQIRVIHEGYAPKPEEISSAVKIKGAYEAAREKGLGVVSLGSKMIDPPVVARALKTLELAESMGIDVSSFYEEKS